MYEIILAGIAAAIITYELNVGRGYGSIESSALVGILFAIISIILDKGNFMNPYIIETIPFVGMGASFAGMSSKKVIPNHIWIALSGAIFSLIFLSSSPLFAGLGGGLGLTACIAVVTTRGIMTFIRTIRINNIYSIK